MAAQSEPEKLPQLYSRERLPDCAPDWLGCSAVKASANGSVKGSPGSPERSQAGQPVEASLETSAATSAGSPARSPASSPAGSADSAPENTPNGFPPLTVARTGQSVWVKRGP